MTLETVTHIADLVAANPTANDPKQQGDDHIRNLKTALLNDLCGFTGAVACAGTDGGVANAYTLTTATALPAYGTKMLAIIAPTVANTGASTLSISGLAAKPLVSVSGAALAAGDLVVGCFYLAVYDGTSFRLTAVTKNYADQLAFSATLPAQAGNAAKFLTTNGTVASWATPPGFSTFMHVRDEKASGTYAGASIVGEQERTLNTVVTNTIPGASLASNRVTLPAGTYQIEARVPSSQVSSTKSYLYNVTDSTYGLIGSSDSSGSGTTLNSFVSGQITIAATKVFSVRQYATTAIATLGLGSAASTGQVEVYAELKIWKVA